MKKKTLEILNYISIGIGIAAAVILIFSIIKNIL